MLPLEWSAVRHAVLLSVRYDGELPQNERLVWYHVAYDGRAQYGYAPRYRALRRDPLQPRDARPVSFVPVSSIEGHVLFAAWRTGLLSVTQSCSSSDDPPAPLALTRVGYQTLDAWDQRRSRQRRSTTSAAGAHRRPTLDEAFQRVYGEYADALRELGGRPLPPRPERNAT